MMRCVVWVWLLSVSVLWADDKAVRIAIDRSLPVLSAAASNYPKHRDCFSCHHHAVPVMAIQAAKDRGWEISDYGLALQVKFTLASFRPRITDIVEGKSIGGANTTAGYALHLLQVVKHPRDDTTDALVHFLLVRQAADGAWPATTQRPPSEGSKFTTAALALEAFDNYGNEELKPKIANARTKAREWIEANEPAYTEDAVFRLRALQLAGSTKDKIDAARTDLLKLQQDDGGWAQLPNTKADAYATGSALVMLRRAGVATTDPVYHRGIGFLLRTQDESGAWLVTTRSRPIQALFDNGDPGGKSQFITVAATGWATLALLETIPVKLPVQGR